jgi:hypothetical protein
VRRCGQPVVAEAHRQHDRRLPGDVEQRQVRGEAGGPLEVLDRTLAVAGALADPQRALGERGREQEVVLGEERDDPARHRLQLGHGAEVRDRVLLA